MEEIIAETAPAVRKRFDERHHYLVSILIGGLIVSIVSLAMNVLFARLYGMTGMMSLSCVTQYAGVFTAVVFYTGILLRMIGYGGGEKRAKAFDLITSVFTILVLLAMAAAAFVFPKHIIALFGNEPNEEMVWTLRVFALTGFLSLIVAAVLGFAVKKRLAFVMIVYGVLLVIALVFVAATVMILSRASTEHVRLLGIVPGIVYPVIYAFPNIGAWRAKKAR